MITAEQLSKIAPTIKGDRAISIAAALDKICPLYGINTPDIFHEFIANVLLESGEFKDLEESLNYSVAALIIKFSRKRISIEDIDKYGRKPGQKANEQALANILYGGDFGKINLGNLFYGDGWTFRGSGPIQNTGRGNITKFTFFFNEKFQTNYSPEEMSELLRTDIEIGIHSACWFFAIAKNLVQLAIDDKFQTIVKRINGGFNGMNERTAYYERAKMYIV